MVVICAQDFESCDGWQGSAVDISDGGMVDDARYLVSAIAEDSAAVALLTFGEQVPAAPAELVLRSQRMSHGRSSGTGQPAALTAALYQGDRLLLSATVVPGGSWREDRLALPEDLTAEPLHLALLVPPGERQVALSRVVIEAAAVALVAPEPDEVSACAVVPAPAAETEKPQGRHRARGEQGRYRGDDPSTPETNEAWVEE